MRNIKVRTAPPTPDKYLLERSAFFPSAQNRWRLLNVEVHLGHLPIPDGKQELLQWFNSNKMTAWQ